MNDNKMQTDHKICLKMTPLDSDTDVPTEHTHLFYANCQKMSIHISQNIVKTSSYRSDIKNSNLKSVIIRSFIRISRVRERAC